MCLSFSLVRKEGGNEGRRKEGRLTIDTQFTSLNNTYSVALF